MAVFAGFGFLFASIAIFTDTAFYRPSASSLEILRAPIITPLNNLLYNSDSSNLAVHGLHPHYQHFLANLPQLLGPAYIVMIMSLFSWPIVPSWMRNVRALSAVSATVVLSIFPHQEARFVIPCVPLLLTCVRIRRSRLLLAAWVLFNAVMGFLMGVYHQGGVVPAQLAMRSIVSAAPEALPQATVFWWKTYPPPLWLLGTNNQTVITTQDLMGIPGVEMIHHLDQTVPDCPSPSDVYLVAPNSASFLDPYMPSSTTRSPALELHPLWEYRKHLNLDDLDFGTDGVFPTLGRVIGRRGLGVWAVRRTCPL